MHDKSVHSMLLAMPLVAPFDPVFDFRVFVGGVVVDHEVKRQTDGCFLFKVLDEAEPFLVGVALSGLADGFPIQIVESRKQRDGAVPDAIRELDTNSLFCIAI